MMTKKKANYEETSSKHGGQTASLKDLAATDYSASCGSGKQVYDYDTLRGRKAKKGAEALSDRIWFDDLPPHTD
jgi:hypothetical protein